MRQVYRLFGLVRRHGAEAVEEACRRALDAEAVNVGLIDRMLTRDAGAQYHVRPPGAATRFVRDTTDFAVGRLRHEHHASHPTPQPAAKPVEVSAELKALMRRLKLGQLLDTLPERLALARPTTCPITTSWSCCSPTRSPAATAKPPQRRARAAHLDPQMQLHAWDDSTAVSYDRQLWAELTSLRFLADAYNVLIMGPVGVGKTFLANALGHIAVRRHHSVHTERADKLFKRLKAPASTPATKTRCADCTASSCSSSTIWHCTGWRPPRPATSTNSSSSGTATPRPSSPATANHPRS